MGMTKKIWIRLYERPECHLCDKVWRWIRALDSEYDLERINIEQDAYWKKWYELHIPVVWVDGIIRLYYPFSKDELYKAFRYIQKTRIRQRQTYERFKYILMYIESRTKEKGPLSYWRKRLAQRVLERSGKQAKPIRVLELATGPAANDGWFPGDWWVYHVDWVHTPFLSQHDHHFGVLADSHLLPFSDHVFDIVVSTFSFCAFLSPQAVLDEIRRVLKPGGCCFFVDHQLPHGYKKYMLKMIKPLWYATAGCYPDRNIGEMFLNTPDIHWNLVESKTGFFILSEGQMPLRN